MKFIANCPHMPADHYLQLTEEFSNPAHEGRFITVLELCPECLPDFLPEGATAQPLDLRQRRRLVEELSAIWRGGSL